MQRRDFLRAFAAFTVAGLPLPNLCAAAPAATTTLSPLSLPQAFDYAWLKGQARGLATGAYQPPVSHIPEAVKALDWDQYQAINYRADKALWAHDRRRFQVKFFHLGLYYTSPVRMHEVVHGQAQELAYDPAMFDYGKSGLSARGLAIDCGRTALRNSRCSRPSGSSGRHQMTEHLRCTRSWIHQASLGHTASPSPRPPR
jgi:glucans biosynthesis protein